MKLPMQPVAWTLSVFMVPPAFAEQSHHLAPSGAAAVAPAGVTFERMQGNLKIMHGAGLSGTGKGSPFLNKIYEPSRHGDVAFQRAVQHGAQAHPDLRRYGTRAGREPR